VRHPPRFAAATPRTCLVLNDRLPIPTTALDGLADRVEVTWCQDPGGSLDVAALFAQHPDTQVLVTTYMDLGADHLRLLPRLELIVATTTAVEYVDLAWCAEHGVTVCGTAGYTGDAVAEHAVALLLAVAKRIVGVNERVHGGDLLLLDEWSVELAGKQLGVLGMGHIGAKVARMARGFGMRVVYLNRGPRDVQAATAVGLPELLQESDAIVVTLPLNATTRGMIGAPELDLMKPTAILVSISPDAVVDLGALADALTSGRILGAGLDVLGEVPGRQPPNLVLSSRFANRTPECFARRQATWVRDLTAYLDGEPPPGQVTTVVPSSM
jgi:lactate dehydrogenase-like 2-hydroxyacid dehydrogenase